MFTLATVFQVSFSLLDILIGLLVIAGIVVLVLLAKVLFSLSKTLKAVSAVVEDNKTNLDSSLANLPSITKSVGSMLTEADGMVKEVKPNLVVTLREVEGITTDVHKLSTDAVDTGEYVAMTAVDTIDNINTGVSSATDYVALIKSILESVKSILK